MSWIKEWILWIYFTPIEWLINFERNTTSPIIVNFLTKYWAPVEEWLFAVKEEAFAYFAAFVPQWALDALPSILWLTSIPSINITIKLSICTAILIAIRGCVPRYRYDFLTKIGWVKFLGYVLAFFLLVVFTLLLW